jgi:hypothetical protein
MMVSNDKRFSIDDVMDFFTRARNDVHRQLTQTWDSSAKNEVDAYTLLKLDKRIAELTVGLFGLGFPDNSLVATRHIKGNKITVYGSTLNGDPPFFYLENEGTDDVYRCLGDTGAGFDTVEEAFQYARRDLNDE